MSTFFNKWKQGLAKTSKATFGQIATFLGATQITAETWDELEGLLVQADLGVETTLEVVQSVQDRVYQQGLTRSGQLFDALRDELRTRLDDPPELDFSSKPTIVLIVGVNGSGKTTSIAKLGKRYTQEGKRVILGAADTYRAAAVDQLQVWADRLNLPVIAGQPGGDAGAVAYDSVQAGISRHTDIVLIDTAGRLHTRFNLMEELKEVYRVVGKAMPEAPHAVWLVMDATTGQNALQQARALKKPSM